MQQQLSIAILLFPIIGFTFPVNAQVTRSVSTSVTRGQSEIVTVSLYPGHGTTLNFRPTGERVRKVWLDDPSQVTLDFDNASCLSEDAQTACAASVIHLRRIKRLNFPDLPATATTSLTVLTDRTLYKFRLSFPNAGSPSYYTVEIQPDQESTRVASVTTTQLQGKSGIQQLNRGLQIASEQNLIMPGDTLWNRVQSLFVLIQQGKPITDAAQQVGVSQALIARLAELGQESHP